MTTEKTERIGRDIFNRIRDEREIDLEGIMKGVQKGEIEISQDLVNEIRKYNETILPKIKELKEKIYSLRSKAESELGFAKETYWDNPDVIAGHTGRCL